MRRAARRRLVRALLVLVLGGVTASVVARWVQRLPVATDLRRSEALDGASLGPDVALADACSELVPPAVDVPPLESAPESAVPSTSDSVEGLQPAPDLAGAAVVEPEAPSVAAVPAELGAAAREPEPAVTVLLAGRRSDLALIRVWARAHGYTVADRGRVAATVVAAYDHAHPAKDASI